MAASQFTASSEISSNLGHTYARLNRYKYWRNDHSNPAAPWLRIDLIDVKTVSGMITQNASPYYVETCHVLYGDNVNSLQEVKDSQGNTQVKEKLTYK